MSSTTSSTPVPGVITSTVSSPTVSTMFSAVFIRLSPTKVRTDRASVVEIVAVIISQRFAVDVAQVDTLKSELVTHFVKIGVPNGRMFSFITDSKSWLDINTADPHNSLLKHIIIPIVLLLTNLLEYTDKILIAGHFLDASVTYNAFASWIFSLSTPSSIIGSVGRSLKPSSNDDHKIPTFKVPIYKGDSLAKDKYMEDVHRTFTNHAMINYINDEVFCASRITWSGSFASRIRDSVAHNEIFGFIATEEKKNNNRAKLWNTVVHELLSVDLWMVRTMAHWNLLLA